MKSDRRIARTRTLLRDALYALIIEKGYDAITVQQIIDRAKVARSSFYVHFRDKDDLLLQGFNEDVDATLSGKMFNPDTPPGSFPEFASALLKSMTTHKTMVRALYTMDPNSLSTQHLRNLLVVQIREWLQRHYDINRQRLEIELAVHYLANGLIGVLAWWVHTDFPYATEEMNRVFNALTQTGLHGLLAPPDARQSISDKILN